MDPFTNYLGQQAFARSKQNSDAAGFHYQWGQKEPRTFATSSLYNEGGINYYGKYPVKVYNGKLELIYQEDIGRDNKEMTPMGGMIYQSSPASSMMETVKNPDIFYGYNSAVISQVGHSKELWDYYWTSYSRGTDGQSHPVAILNRHNTYLDGYIVLRSKSIYDPCPYGYRTPTNGTYNDFRTNAWINYSYAGGVLFTDNWFHSLGRKSSQSFSAVGYFRGLRTATNVYSNAIYVSLIFSTHISFSHSNQNQSMGYSIRCIEDATVKADDSEASASY